MLNLQHKLLLLIGAVLLLGLVLFQAVAYRIVTAHAEADLMASAERVRNVLMATRRVYHHQFIDSGLPLNEKTLGFLPAHALSRISDDLANWDRTGFSFNNVSDRPRNPSQRADAVELEAIAHFRANPEQAVRFVPYETGGEPYYHYARPIWVEKYCLGCHGARESAPATIGELYDSAYDYELGDLRGILSVKVPARHVRERIASTFVGLSLWGLGVFAVLWLGLAWVMRRQVARPLAALSQGIGQLAAGDLSDRVATLPGEFGRIGLAFNEMAGSLERERVELLASESRFRTLAETAADAIVLADGADRVLFWNEGAVRLFAYAPEAMLGQPFARLLPEGTAPADLRAWSGRIVELEALDRDGRRIPVEVAVNDWDSEGERFFVAVLRDLRARKAAEEGLLLSANVFSKAREGILVTDRERRIIDVNPAFTELTGYARDELLGQDPRLLKSGRHDDAFYRDLWASLAGRGYWRGEIWNRRKDGSLFVGNLTISSVRGGDGELQQYVGIVTDVTDLKESRDRLERMAHFDPLTGLPNRILLSDRLAQALALARRRRGLVAVCFMDLDGFKPINEAHGREVGDRLLVELGERLGRSVRSGDTVARLGGDEFGLLLTDVADLAELDAVLQRVLAAVARPCRLAAATIETSGSIGATVFPWDEADPDTLLRHADVAMYQAKQQGRNRYRLFDTDQDRQMQARQKRTARIEQALAEGEFVLYYQPKVDLRRGTAVGVEALIRWQHPERGIVAPGEFLPLAEESDLIVAIGEWTLREALRQAQVWADAGTALPVSVNIAARHLQRDDFLARIEALLGEYPGLSPSLLELEVLETAALDDIAKVRRVIAACRALGIDFALDDFGTGYSSMMYLKTLAPGTLKIDRSFVMGMLDEPDDLTIVEGIIGLAGAFQRRIVAEGVESTEHARLLLQLGCDVAQGFGIARPMPADALTDWLRTWRNDPGIAELAELHWEREDFHLLAIGTRHRAWVRRFTEAIEQGARPAVELAATDCDFGRWYHGPGRRRYGRYPAFTEIATLHGGLHAAARAIAECHLAGDHAGAVQRLGQLHERHAALAEALIRLQLAVAVREPVPSSGTLRG